MKDQSDTKSNGWADVPKRRHLFNLDGTRSLKDGQIQNCGREIGRRRILII
jgi:hypothetical protein